MAENYDKQILEKLDVILRVLAIDVVGEMSITDAAWTLKQAGLDNQTIAEILNTSTATIRTLISRRSSK